MKNPRLTAAFAVALSLLGNGIASAALMPNVVSEPTRFSGGCCVYTGAPALKVTLSMVEAGGGPKDFSTVTLLKVLTGPLFDAAVRSVRFKSP